jgi:hypothetical protein
MLKMLRSFVRHGQGRVLAVALLVFATVAARAEPGAVPDAGLRGSSWSSAPAGAAESSSPGWPRRAGRLSDFQGRVWLFDTEQGQWSEALRNRALTEGDRLSTERGAQAEVRVGSTELRLGAGTELEIVRMDDARMSFQLHRGSLAVRVRSREIAAELELLTSEARLQPERAGAYRVDREDDTTWATAWRGALQVQTVDQTFDLPAGQRVELTLRGRDRATWVTWSGAVQDRFAEWVQADEQRDDRSASLRYVSPEMTGVEELDRHGRWERHPEFGMVWSPLVVTAGWAPFKHGRWIWHTRWGWTWVDQAPWGFAPFHYGRWVLWGHRWVWTPGPRVARPGFAPALVTFTAPSVGVSVVIGPSRPPVTWVPLAPREPYRPWIGHRPHPVEPVHRPHLTPVPHVSHAPHSPHSAHSAHAPYSPPVSVAPELPVRPSPVAPAPRPHVGDTVARPDRRHTPPPATMPGYGQGRLRETDEVLAPSGAPGSPEVSRPPRATAPVAAAAPAPVLRLPPAEPQARGRPESAAPRSERPDNFNPADRAHKDKGERSERSDRRGPPDSAEGRGRSTTEHRPRDQRERAQML